MNLRWNALALLLCCACLPACAQDLNLAPVRPMIANSATIQDKGVLQVEMGYDTYPRNPPGDQQTVAASFFYAPLARLRLDFNWSAFSHQEDENGTVNGVGTVQIGGKVEVKKEQFHRPAPGIAVQYEAELPTASKHGLQGYGQQAILLVNHHYGRNGDIDLMVNGSVVQDCEQAQCSYGGQQAIAVSYHLQEKTRLYAEVFGQNVSQADTPPGTYAFGGFYHQFGKALGINGGLRFGISDRSARVGTTVGLVFGKRLRG